MATKATTETTPATDTTDTGTAPPSTGPILAGTTTTTTSPTSDPRPPTTTGGTTTGSGSGSGKRETDSSQDSPSHASGSRASHASTAQPSGPNTGMNVSFDSREPQRGTDSLPLHRSGADGAESVPPPAPRRVPEPVRAPEPVPMSAPAPASAPAREQAMSESAESSAPGASKSATQPGLNSVQAIGSDDLVLAFNFQNKLAPPKGVNRWDDLPCGPNRLRTLNEPELGLALRDVRIDVNAWQEAMGRIYRKLESVARENARRIHVFFNGPHPLGLWLGHQLEVQCRQTPLLIHQFDASSNDWQACLDMSADATSLVCHTLSLRASTGTVQRDGHGTVLSLEVPNAATASQLEALRTLVRAEAIERIRGLGEGRVLIPPGEQSRAALQHVFAQLSSIRAERQDSPIYLATSAPISLLIGLGKKLPRTVFPQLWCCSYDAESGRYIPMLEVSRGQVADAVRPRLEVIEKEHGVLFRLNGKLLEAVGSNQGEKKPLNRKSYGNTDENALNLGLEALSASLLPAEVEEEIRKLPSLDIELKLLQAGDNAKRADSKLRLANASWELLKLTRTTRDFALLTKDWTLTRLYTPSRPTPLLQPQKVEDLRILIVPSLDPNDQRCSEALAEQYLQLKPLEMNLKQLGARNTYRMPYGVTLPELEDALRTVKPHILHWIGHGMPDRADGWPQVLELSNGTELTRLDRSQIPQFIRLTEGSLRLLVLSACSAGGPANGYGVPGILLEHGVGAVIGYRDPVGIGEVGWFSESFYPALLAGASIRDALAVARSHIKRQNGFVSSFAAPILCASSPQAVGAMVRRGGGNLSL